MSGQRYSLIRQKYEFELEDEDGDVQEYYIKELSGSERDAYLQSLTSRMKQRGDSATMQNFQGFQADLLGKCTYHVNGEEDTLVKGSVIQGWPAKILQELYDKASEMSGLKNMDDEEKKAKND